MSWFVASKKKGFIKCRLCRVNFPGSDFAGTKDCPQCHSNGEEKRVEINPLDPTFTNEKEALDRISDAKGDK